MKIQVIDKPISDEFADILYNEITSNSFKWSLQRNIAGHDISDDISYGFSHWLFSKGQVTSNRFFLFLNLLYHCDKVSDVIQVRTFMHTPSLKPGTENGRHTDLDYPHKVCLYYVNDSDGDTLFFDDDGNEIARNTPKKNTAVLFDGNITHCSSTPSSFRYIINFDYL